MNDFEVRYFDMAIRGLEEHRFVVAKLRRVSSPPVRVGSVADPLASAFGGLVDIVRLGRKSRNFADLRAIEWLLRERWNLDAETEWAAYEQVICRMLGVERLELFRPARIRLAASGIVFHDAEMNELPYLVARIDDIIGSPAPVFLTYPHHRESALARLHDVFRIGRRKLSSRE